MPTFATAPQILDREFLEIRCKILEVAAALDRLDRAAGSVASDRRMGMIRDALAILIAEHPERAEQVQMIFSRRYDPGWKQDFKLPTSHRP